MKSADYFVINTLFATTLNTTDMMRTVK